MTIRLSLAAVLLLASAAVAQTPKVEPLPTQQEIGATYAAGDYQKTLQKLGKVLVLKGKTAEPYDRHALLVMKGESHLRIKGSAAAAAQAFGEASKEAPDGPSAAADIATELLLKRVNAGLTYQPRAKDPADKTKTQAPIPVVEPADRKRAIDALYADERAVVEPRIKAVGSTGTLSAVIEALPAIRNLRWLEMASTGKDAVSVEATTALAAKAKKLTTEALADMDKSFEGVVLTANEVIDARVPVNDRQTGRLIRIDTKYKRRGPTNRQFATLRETFDTCGKIYASCDELGGSLGATGKEFDEVKAKAEAIGARARRLLDAPWNETYDRPPAPIQ